MQNQQSQESFEQMLDIQRQKSAMHFFNANGANFAYILRNEQGDSVKTQSVAETAELIFSTKGYKRVFDSKGQWADYDNNADAIGGLGGGDICQAMRNELKRLKAEKIIAENAIEILEIDNAKLWDKNRKEKGLQGLIIFSETPLKEISSQDGYVGIRLNKSDNHYALAYFNEQGEIADIQRTTKEKAEKYALA